MIGHPVHVLKDTLDRKRLELIEVLAEGGKEPSTEALTQLATVQTALMAVGEAIEAHEPRLGWGPSEALK
jgi:hypothetical protein